MTCPRRRKWSSHTLEGRGVLGVHGLRDLFLASPLELQPLRSPENLQRLCCLLKVSGSAPTRRERVSELALRPVPGGPGFPPRALLHRRPLLSLAPASWLLTAAHSPAHMPSTSFPSPASCFQHQTSRQEFSCLASSFPLLPRMRLHRQHPGRFPPGAAGCLPGPCPC